MKYHAFKHILLVTLLLLPLAGKCEDRDRKGFWSSIIPRTVVVQYAGNIGAVSAGAEWSYGKNGRWGTSLLFGYLPKHHSDCAKGTVTLKQRFTPFNIRVKENIDFRPLECGIFFNTIMNGEFWIAEPDKYPKGYYGFATRVRSNIFIGQRFDFLLPAKYKCNIKSLSVYYELSTSDFHICSYFPNYKYLDLSDLFCLGVGMKMNF